MLEVDGVYYGMCSYAHMKILCFSSPSHIITVLTCRILGLPSLWSSPAPWAPHNSLQNSTRNKRNSKVYFDLLSILYDLHQTLLISNLILLFPFYFAGITSAESWYEVFSKWLTCNLVWKSLLSWTAVLLLQVITRVISISHIYRCYSLYILSF